MDRKAVYGLPINPAHLLEQLVGGSFCVSFGTRDRLGKQLDDAIRLVGEDGILLVDNGAFSLHKRGQSSRDESYQDDYEAWAQDILDRSPQAIAVIPDVIGGTEAENAELVNTTMLPYERAMPVWHMHESLDYLLHLCDGFNYIGIGSSGAYWKVGSPEWHERIAEAFAAIEQWEADGEGANLRPRIHMMRAQSQAHLYPFDSSDSTNVAMNHGRYRHEGAGHVERLARRASAKILAASGPEAEHQTKRPLLDHLEAGIWREQFAYQWEASTEGGNMQITHTPWGRPDHVEKLADGIYAVSTPSHGGIYLEKEQNAKVPMAWKLASFDQRGVNGWYEEDCDWCLAALTFPEAFSELELKAARETFGYFIAAKVGPRGWREVEA